MSKPATNGTASDATRPFTLRLAARDIEQLQARAHVVSGTVTGIARELIVTALAGGDDRAMAERLMQIERRLAARRRTREIADSADRIEAAVTDCESSSMRCSRRCRPGRARPDAQSQGHFPSAAARRDRAVALIYSGSRSAGHPPVIYLPGESNQPLLL